MVTRDHELRRGLAALRVALRHVLDPQACPSGMAGARGAGRLYADALGVSRPPSDSGRSRGSGGSRAGVPVGIGPTSSRGEAEASRLVALVDLARGGDAEAFGQLYDHYHESVYRFVRYRVGSAALAEDITSETFFRALRGMSSFQWQGKDFGAWLTTIARNLSADHFKAGRTRLETPTDDMSAHDAPTEGPETSVLASLTNEVLLGALTELPHEQQECLVMRFLQGLSIAETATVLGRSEGAVKQLQLRGVRNLAKLLPEGIR
jgi:RNA polymerase sigma-70 factor (ECF subfamily)